MGRTRRYWLVKSEPGTYSIADLERDGRTEWDGVRNYKARNYMRDDMKSGDRVLYYHSNTDPLGVYGVAEVCTEAHPDSTQFDASSKYHDPNSTRDEPRWWCVDLAHLETFDGPVTRDRMKEEAALAEMGVLKRGMRLSVMPVEREEFEHIVRLGRAGG